jgi:hypothetical protein
MDERRGRVDRILWTKPLHGPSPSAIFDRPSRGALFKYEDSCNGGLVAICIMGSKLTPPFHPQGPRILRKECTIAGFMLETGP